MGTRGNRVSAGQTVLAGMVIWGFVGSNAALAQGDRLERFEPGLIVETGARMGACDVVAFTPDGRFLLAAGDDKVVRIWRHSDAGLDPQPVQILRWSIFREQRGNIYALAISPDPAYRLVAVGGLGVRAGSGTVALIDRVSGEVVKAMLDPQATTYAVWSVAFSPSGNRVAFGKGDGLVGVWDLKAKRPDDVIRLGSHVRKDKRPANKVRLVAFQGEDRLLSLAEDGQLLQWNVARPREAPVALHSFGTSHLWQSRISPDGRWIGMISQRDALKAAVYEVKSGAVMPIRLSADEQPHSLALDGTDRLALGTWTNPLLKGAAGGARVVIQDLRRKGAAPQAGPKSSYYMDALAFHPAGQRLVIGSGADHEVTLWDLNRPNLPISTIAGPGSCLWSVALSRDGRYLGFHDRVAIDSPDVNQRGKGEGRVFDLQQRTWADRSLAFEPVRPVESAGSWKVQLTDDPQVWNVVGPTGTAYPLPLDPVRDALPRCYTFLTGKTPRLAVGHFWGVSIFDLTKDGPVRSRLMVGHQGEVMSVAPSADMKQLVTASRDQTLAAWSLADWPSHAELGARFLTRDGRVWVDEVDPGSPAWEAGLSKGDEVTLVAFAGLKVEGGPDAWLARLRQPVPGVELYLDVRRERAGKTQVVPILTTVRQRPLWRFFPTRDGEWVLWRWRDYYYDCSTNGDAHIGWQVSGDVEVTPAYYKAEQFRRRYHKPAKVAELLAGVNEPERDVRIPDIEPPDVRLVVNTKEVKDQDVEVTIQVQARRQEPNHQLERVLLWVNDYQFRTIPVAGAAFQQKLVVPRDRLRRGPNLLTLQCYNRAEVRGEAPPVLVENVRPAAPARLFGLFIGVGDYGLAKRPVRYLRADDDAEAMYEAWLEQKNRQFRDVETTVLLNRQATPLEVLKRLDALARHVQPDDQLVVYLGGHGISTEDLQRHAQAALGKKGKAPALPALPPGSFFFLGPAFDPLRPLDTCITGQDLYERIARLPCRKLVLLDTCHAGTATVNPVRELTRDGVGPVIVAACQPREQAMEWGPIDFNRAHGLFTMAARRALQEEFDKADADGDGTIEAGELVAFLKARVPRFVQDLKDRKVRGIRPEDTQQPAAFLPRMEERVPVARK